MRSTAIDDTNTICSAAPLDECIATVWPVHADLSLQARFGGKHFVHVTSLSSRTDDSE